MSNSPPASASAARVLDRLGPAISGPSRWRRRSLMIAAALQVGLALPWLVSSDPLGVLGEATEAHMARDGALGCVVGVAGLVVAWRFRYAVAAAIVCGSVLLIQLATGIVDGWAHHTTPLLELSHLLGVVITGLVLWAARPLVGIEQVWSTSERRAPFEV